MKLKVSIPYPIVLQEENEFFMKKWGFYELKPNQFVLLALALPACVQESSLSNKAILSHHMLF